MKPTNPQEEIEKGRVAVWLTPDDIRWLARHLAQLDSDDWNTRQRIGNLRFRLLTALHKSGHDNNIWSDGIIESEAVRITPMVIEQQIISAETFWELMQEPEYADTSWELVEGEMVAMVKPGGKHGQIAGNIFGFLWNYGREHKLGYVTAAETGYILKKNPGGKDTVRGLDVGYVSKERAPKGLPEKHIPFAPDLAVEVISKGNEAADIRKKIRELLDAGTTLIWIVYPEIEEVDVYTNENAVSFKIGDTLTGGDVLPGFELPVREIFANPMT